MSILSILFGTGENQRVKKLEARVKELEGALLEMSEMLKKVASLSLQTGRELEGLSEYVKRQERVSRTATPAKKTDDFYN